MIVGHLSVLLLSTSAAAYRLPSGLVRSPRATRTRAVTASADADALAALKRSFYGAADREEVMEEADDPPVGLLRDMPLCRWPWEVLPHHQRVIVVHEPQYILMFEKLLASPAPHEYVHLLLHRGDDDEDLNNNPEYALRPGSKAALAGTLMRVVASLREEVQTSTAGLKVEGLVMVVQGLARVHVTKQTQGSPYSRADVMLAPDAEVIRASARLSRKWLRSTDGLRRTDGVLRTRLALAAAAAEEEYWREWEWSNASLAALQGGGGEATSTEARPTQRGDTLCGLNASHTQGRMRLAADAAIAAMGQLTLLDVEAMRAEEETKAGSDAKETIVEAMEAEVKAQAEWEASNRTEAWPHEQTRDLTAVLPKGAADESWRNASAWHTEWLVSLLDEVEDYAVGGEAELGRKVDAGSTAAAQVALQGAQVDDAEQQEDLRTLADLELQVWLELDGLTNPDGLRGPQAAGTKPNAAAFMTDGDVPDELLELLPPPPEGNGWPDEFGLLKLAESRQARAKLNRLFAASDAGPSDAGPAQQPSGSAAQSTTDLQLLGLASVGQPDEDDIFLPLADDSEEAPDDDPKTNDGSETNGGSASSPDDSEAAGAGGYPLRRRAMRLSYAIWAVISEESAPLQRVLEVTSAAERLRYAVLRMRTLTGRQFRPPDLDS